jgi:hypothetical protein
MSLPYLEAIASPVQAAAARLGCGPPPAPEAKLPARPYPKTLRAWSRRYRADKRVAQDALDALAATAAKGPS